MTLNPFILLGGITAPRPWVGRGIVRVKCLHQKHNTVICLEDNQTTILYTSSSYWGLNPPLMNFSKAFRSLSGHYSSAARKRRERLRTHASTRIFLFSEHLSRSVYRYWYNATGYRLPSFHQAGRVAHGNTSLKKLKERMTNCIYSEMKVTASKGRCLPYCVLIHLITRTSFNWLESELWIPS